MLSGWRLREKKAPSSLCQGSGSLIECKPVKECCLSPYRAYKTIEDDDLKFPLIYGEGKKVGIRLPQMENRAAAQSPRQPVPLPAPGSAALTAGENIASSVLQASCLRVQGVQGGEGCGKRRGGRSVL